MVFDGGFQYVVRNVRGGRAVCGTFVIGGVRVVEERLRGHNGDSRRSLKENIDVC